MNQSLTDRGPVSLWRRAAACMTVAAGLVLGAATPAAAHDGVILTLHGDGRGSVWVTAAWQDGHPVTEAVGITLLATTTDGRRAGPAGLSRNGDALTYAGTLAAGDWTVVAEMGTPAIGRCQGVLHVAADGAPQDIVCAPPPVVTTPAPAPAAKASYAWVWYALGVVALAGLAAWWLHRTSIAARATARRTPGRKTSARRTTTRRK